MTDNPRPGKFEGNESAVISEFLYEKSLEGWAEDYGESDTLWGWNTLIPVEATTIKSWIMGELTALYLESPNDRFQLIPEISEKIYNFMTKIKPAYICTEDSQGFFDYEEFNSEEEAKKAFDKSQTQYYKEIEQDEQR